MSTHVEFRPGRWRGVPKIANDMNLCFGREMAHSMVSAVISQSGACEISLESPSPFGFSITHGFLGKGLGRVSRKPRTHCITLARKRLRAHSSGVEVRRGATTCK